MFGIPLPTQCKWTRLAHFGGKPQWQNRRSAPAPGGFSPHPTGNPGSAPEPRENFVLLFDFVTETKSRSLCRQCQNLAPLSGHTSSWITCFVCLVTSPMVPSFWRGCWFLYGHYVFPGNPAVHGWIMTVIGNLVAVPLYLMQNKLTRWLGNRHSITWLLGYHSFLLVFTLTSVAQ